MVLTACFRTATTAFALTCSAAQACPPAPPAIRDIEANSFYVDAHHSVIDKALEKQYHDNIEPLETFLRQVASMADQSVSKQDEAAGRCAVAWLDTWAEGGAMLGRMLNGRGDTQAQFERKWMLAGLSLAYLKVVRLATPDQAQHIAAWMQRIADESLALFESPKHKRNNHYYWVGLAVMGTAIGTNSRAHLERARGVFDKALGDIQADGTLPMELDRAGMALHYHNYALAPLVLMAELAKTAGEDWYARQDGKLAKLVDAVAAGIKDPAIFAQRVGVKQKLVQGTSLCWALIYRPSGEMVPLEALAPSAVCRYNHFGGSVSVLAQVVRTRR